MSANALLSLRLFNELVKAAKWQLQDGRWRTHGPSGNVIDTTPPGSGDTVVNRAEMPEGHQRVDIAALRSYAHKPGDTPAAGQSKEEREAKAKHTLDLMQRFGIAPTESWLKRNKQTLGGIYGDVERYLRKLWATQGKPEGHKSPSERAAEAEEVVSVEPVDHRKLARAALSAKKKRRK